MIRNNDFVKKQMFQQNLSTKKIKIVTQFFKNELNFDNFEQMLHSSIFPILSPKISKIHVFENDQNRKKVEQKN